MEATNLWPNAGIFASREISVPCATEGSFATGPIKLTRDVVSFEFWFVAIKCIVAIRAATFNYERLIPLNAFDRLHDTHSSSSSVFPVIGNSGPNGPEQLNDLDTSNDWFVLGVLRKGIEKSRSSASRDTTGN